MPIRTTVDPKAPVCGPLTYAARRVRPLLTAAETARFTGLRLANGALPFTAFLVTTFAERMPFTMTGCFALVVPCTGFLLTGRFGLDALLRAGTAAIRFGLLCAPRVAGFGAVAFFSVGRLGFSFSGAGRRAFADLGVARCGTCFAEVFKAIVFGAFATARVPTFAFFDCVASGIGFTGALFLVAATVTLLFSPVAAL